jgi:hypothetical protein
VIWMLLACRGDPEPTSPDSPDLHAGPFQSAAECADCHPRQVQDWTESMHAHAARSPVFRAFEELASEEHGLGEFCNECHRPLEREGLGHEGITCDVCHTAVGTGGETSTGLVHAPGTLKRGPYSSTYEGEHAGVEDEFVTSSQLCGSCHEITLPSGLKVEETLAEYEASPAPASGIRCQDCHMGPDPGMPELRDTGVSGLDEDGQPYNASRVVTDHHFVGPDHAMEPNWPYPDDLERSAQVQQANRERTRQLMANAAHFIDVQHSLAGEVVTVTAQVESTTIGHRLPTGFTSERQLWLALTVTDDAGAVVFASGDLDEDGDLRNRWSARVQAGEVELDEQLHNLQSRNWLGDEEIALPLEADRIELRGMEPLELREFSWSLPASDQALHGKVTLNFRSFPPYLLRELSLSQLVPQLRVLVIDHFDFEIPP